MRENASGLALPGMIKGAAIGVPSQTCITMHKAAKGETIWRAEHALG